MGKDDEIDVDRRVMANLRGCKQKKSYLEGAGCTKQCEHRKTCKIKRVKFLVQAHNFKARFVEATQINGVHAAIFQIEAHAPDEYINGVLGVKQ